MILLQKFKKKKKAYNILQYFFTNQILKKKYIIKFFYNP